MTTTLQLQLPRFVWASERARTDMFQRIQNHSNVVWYPYNPKMYVGTLGYNFQIFLYLKLWHSRVHSIPLITRPLGPAKTHVLSVPPPIRSNLLWENQFCHQILPPLKQYRALSGRVVSGLYSSHCRIRTNGKLFWPFVQVMRWFWTNGKLLTISLIRLGALNIILI